ncbi:hypothetical protein CWI42_040060 [Ordospora colligata]|uniref:Uncharacterized protein n=1 Tax=Ordospora colligata OC4 TaxID=1354746 RepID=A0A0B2UKS0_9MICR|nr:uncharacterized protein M896_040060 [Ordospora colligata OC4]KHN69814.1 hypothetical protein M896_040060 [Ordospora colligata OC4]TBU15984.1 hypothetical protein CWI41_040060 [Ordospora colligata]TBU16197.1 hypothetical protein CWI40_040060 [Ordospora colligata]TBU18901.1 hypothetical protein CWI42_040060 [Ordospora colligata]
MNSDLIAKVIPRLDKPSVKSLCVIINDSEYYTHTFIKYRYRQNIMSVDRICTILHKMINLGNIIMAFEFLASIPAGKMMRVILKLIENLDLQRSFISILQSALIQLDKGCSKELIRYKIIATHIQSIITNINAHTKYCK